MLETDGDADWKSTTPELLDSTTVDPLILRVDVNSSCEETSNVAALTSTVMSNVAEAPTDTVDPDKKLYFPAPTNARSARMSNLLCPLK